MSQARVMLYVQHLLGTGHQHRMAAISRALAGAGLEVCYVSGGAPIAGLQTHAHCTLQLPPARVADTRYDTLLDMEGIPVDDGWRRRRAKLLLDGFESFSPDCLVVESFPFGRRLVRFELLPVLQAAKRRRKPPRIFCSIRDILEPKTKQERNAQTVLDLHEYFDGVLVHGDPRLVTLDATFALASRIREMVHYTGYVVCKHASNTAGSTAGSGEVIVSAGGGVVAERLLRAVFAARSHTRLGDHPWRCLVGSNLERERFEELVGIVPAGVTLERNRGDFQTLLCNCKLSVSQAGYNTAVDVLLSGAPAVLAPFGDGHEREQSLRAQALAEQGWVQVVHPAELTARRLALAVDEAVRAGRREVPAIDFDGAACTVRILRNALHA